MGAGGQELPRVREIRRSAVRGSLKLSGLMTHGCATSCLSGKAACHAVMSHQSQGSGETGHCLAERGDDAADQLEQDYRGQKDEEPVSLQQVLAERDHDA